MVAFTWSVCIRFSNDSRSRLLILSVCVISLVVKTGVLVSDGVFSGVAGSDSPLDDDESIAFSDGITSAMPGIMKEWCGILEQKAKTKTNLNVLDVERKHCNEVSA